MNLLKNIVFSFFKIFSVHRLFNQLNDIESISKCYKMSNAENAMFYSESEIDNQQKNPQKIKIGKNTHVRGRLLVFGYGGEISIGDNSYIGKDSNIWSADQIEIGDNVLISHNVNIIDTNSHEINYLERAEAFCDLIKEGPPKINKFHVPASRIVIEDNVWISFNVIILKGVKIGEGAIIAAGSVVTKDVEPFTMVGGNPAISLKKINEI